MLSVLLKSTIYSLGSQIYTLLQVSSFLEFSYSYSSFFGKRKKDYLRYIARYLYIYIRYVYKVGTYMCIDIRKKRKEKKKAYLQCMQVSIYTLGKVDQVYVHIRIHIHIRILSACAYAYTSRNLGTYLSQLPVPTYGTRKSSFQSFPEAILYYLYGLSSS